MGNDLKLNLQSLKETSSQIEKLKKRSEEIRKYHYEYEQIWEDISKLERNARKIQSFLSNENWKFEPELKKIAKKIIEAKENHKIFDKNANYLLFDEVLDNFVSLGKDGASYHLELIQTHFRHYDVMEVLKGIERITAMKVKEWYLLTTDSLHRPAWNLSITLIHNDITLGKEGVK